VRVLIALVLLVWSAVFAAVIVEGHSGDSTGPAAGRPGMPAASDWMMLVRTGAGWRSVRGPFAGPEACLRVRDVLNNRDHGAVYDCDQDPGDGGVRPGRSASGQASRQ
jgi:hypothetical protein